MWHYVDDDDDDEEETTLTVNKMSPKNSHLNFLTGAKEIFGVPTKWLYQLFVNISL